MEHALSPVTQEELIAALAHRYRSARKAEKSRILDELVKIVGCHRKHAIRLLSRRAASEEKASLRTRTNGRVYGDAIRETLIVLWEASDRICGKRLQALIPTLVAAMERHGHLQLQPEVRAGVLAVSAATIDRLLRPAREPTHGRRRRRRSANKPARKIPIKTFTEWEDSPPGFLEIDMVAHCGGNMNGSFIHSLVATDVCSGWVEAVPLLAREQSIVVEGLTVLGERFPMPVRGINCDNDSAFINDSLINYCEESHIKFTRARAYKKNDQAWIEQKNGAVVRGLMGYDRYSGVVAGQAMAQLYGAARLYVNFFQPSSKLRHKERHGARVKKYYWPPATPCSRLLECTDVEEDAKATLRQTGTALDPLALLHRIREIQGALAALTPDEKHSKPDRDSLENFLSGLSQLWKAGEARPTHTPHKAPKRTWRTRQDPFEGVWAETLEWLQQEPELDGRQLLDRLQERYPGQYDDGKLRTLQRRIRQWRCHVARKLVFNSDPPDKESPTVSPIGAASNRTSAR